MTAPNIPENTTGLLAGSLQARSWVAGGWQLYRQNLYTYLAMAALYTVSAMILNKLPFLGNLIIILLTPFMFVSVLLDLRDQKTPEQPQIPLMSSASFKSRLNQFYLQYVHEPARRLMRIFTDTDQHRLFMLVQLSIVILGMVLLVGIVEYFVTGGPAVKALRAYGSVLPPLWLIFGLFLGITLKIALGMALLYALPRTIFDDTEPLHALADSFRACHRNPWAVTLFALVFFVLYSVIIAGFTLSSVIGYFVLFVLGISTLPLLITSSYVSYRELFAATRER